MSAFERILLILLCAAMSACEQSSVSGEPAAVVPAPAIAAPLTQAVDSTYPRFKVDVQLTPAAQEQLSRSDNKIGLSFEFGTERGPESPNTISHRMELTKPGLIDTESFGLTAEAVAKLGSDYEVQVSGYSTSATDLNFLDCTIIVGNFSSLRDRTHVLACGVLKLD
jgi:hypothetical protein